MAIIVGCKCDCPIVGYQATDTPLGSVLVSNTAGHMIPIKAHKENCYHRMHVRLQPVAVL